MIICLLLILVGEYSYSQFSHLNYYWTNRILFQQQSAYGFICPIILFDSASNNYIQQINNIEIRTKKFDNPLITIVKKDFNLYVNPIIDIEHKTGINKFIAKNTRGIMCSGQLSNNFFFYTDFTENQEYFHKYIIDYIKLNKVIPGQGRPKPFKNDGFDYFNSSSYIGIKISEKLSFCGGHFKSFIGYGYRSLLYSDNSFQSPTLRISFLHKYFQYISSYSVFYNATIEDNIYVPYSKRFFKYNILNFSPDNNISIAIFDASIFLPHSYKKLYPNFYYYFPILGLNEVKFGLDDSTNSLIGTMCELNYKKKIFLYSQLVYDGKYNNTKQYAYQAGIKLCKAHKHFRLILLTEINYASDYVYKNVNSKSSFINYNEYIAHPFGNNLYEKLFKFYFQYKRIYLDLLFSTSTAIPLHDNLNESLREKAKLRIFNIEGGFYLHRSSFTTFFSGYYIRCIENTPNFHYFYGGIKTNIFNRYL